MSLTYSECLDEMYGLRRFGIKLVLEPIKNLLNELGNPHKKFKSVHIAGTNGKGSVASMLTSILHEAGFKTGLYTSPHLIHINERFCVSKEPITDDRIVDLYQTVKKLHKGDRNLTFFEYTTAMAFYEFARENVDWAIIETGMGGRLDATNALLPQISIITNISLEHQEYLGNTLKQIAGEKAGIIKNKRPVITDVRQYPAYLEIKKIAKEKSAPFYRLGTEIKLRQSKDKSFTYYGINNKWKNLKLALPGNHQFRNAGLALAACDLISRKQHCIDEKHVKDGLLNVKWPGRLEIVSKSPQLILDGAHNLMAVHRLADYLRENTDKDELTLIIGILSDKPYGDILKTLLPLARSVILTCPKIDRGLNADELKTFAKNFISDIKVINDVGDAVRYALEKSDKKETICVAGSLYVVGEAKAELLNMKDQIFLA